MKKIYTTINQHTTYLSYQNEPPLKQAKSFEVQTYRISNRGKYEENKEVDDDNYKQYVEMLK